MKRIILLLLLVFAVSAHAQIQRKFYNFTFGLTQKSQVYNYFKAKGNRIRNIDDLFLVLQQQILPGLLHVF